MDLLEVTVLSVFVLGYALVSQRLKTTPLTGPMSACSRLPQTWSSTAAGLDIAQRSKYVRRRSGSDVWVIATMSRTRAFCGLRLSACTAPAASRSTLLA